MRDSQKVYIKGDSSRGDEVIKTLIGLGGINLNNLDGKGEDTYYYISPLGIIIGVASYEKNMMSILKEFYKEIKLPKWKPKNNEYYYRITWIGKVSEDIWYGSRNDESGYKFGNCFKTIKEAESVRDKIKEILNKSVCQY